MNGNGLLNTTATTLDEYIKLMTAKLHIREASDLADTESEVTFEDVAAVLMSVSKRLRQQDASKA